MDSERVFELLHESGGMLEGHFELSSGNHSDRYFQCAKVLQHPEFAGELARGVAAAVGELDIQVIVGPAMGAVVWSYAVAAAVGVRSLFTERVDGAMTLRRGFHLEPNERVLVVEDALSTGGSAREAIEVVRQTGATVVGVASIVNRSGGNPFEADDLPLFALCDVRAEMWQPAQCPLCVGGDIAIKPGSRPGASSGV